VSAFIESRMAASSVLLMTLL